MFSISRFNILAVVVAATAGLSLAPLAHANLLPVFESDFSGTGSGGSVTGTTGGTATLASKTGATASIGNGNLFGGPGGNLTIAETGGTNSIAYAGASIVPTSMANGFGSWYSATGSGSGGADNTINGSFDYFYKDSLASTSWGVNTSQPLFLPSGTNPFFGIALQSQPNGFQFWVHNGGTSNLEAGNYGSNPTGTAGLGSANSGVAADTLIHIAGTVSTNASTGFVTAKLYVVTGNNAITPGTTPVFATATSSVPFTTTTGPATNFTFGDNAFTSVAQTEQFDQFRIYDGTPTTFSALPITTPEPASLGLLAVGGLGLLLLGKRRHA